MRVKIFLSPDKQYEEMESIMDLTTPGVRHQNVRITDLSQTDGAYEAMLMLRD